MAEFVGTLFLIAFFAVVFLVIRFVWRIIVGMWRMGTTPANPQGQQPGRQPGTQTGVQDPGMSAEEEGNVHSGPYGYSPNTAYPETQYGSMFDPDAEWNHEEQ